MSWPGKVKKRVNGSDLAASFKCEHSLQNTEYLRSTVRTQLAVSEPSTEALMFSDTSKGNGPADDEHSPLSSRESNKVQLRSHHRGGSKLLVKRVNHVGIRAGQMGRQVAQEATENSVGQEKTHETGSMGVSDS